MILPFKRKEKKDSLKLEKKVQKEPTPQDFQIIKRPVISEKSSFLEKKGKYVFEVPLGANKTEIKKAVERIYNTKVEKVNIIKRKGKRKRWLRLWGKKPDTKKAIVTLKKGQKIEILSR